MQTVSVDIGSTWTKAALFAHEGEELTLVNHVLTPTTTHHLADGFFASLNQVLNVADARPLLKSGEVQLEYSSSAKGGLAVAAMGLVPSITLESAKVTAHSAGAKIAQYYSYKLNRHDIQELESSPPDILLFTGAVTRAMRSPALRAWQSAPDPKICISYGACGNSGGIFHDLYCVWGGTDKIVPVDVYIPGCPPTPAATLYGFAMALGLLEQKIHARLPGEQDERPTELLHPDMVQPLRVRIDREARRLAGYRYGRQIADDYMRLLGQGDSQVVRWLEAEKDPRLTEIVTHLNQVVEGARIR